MSADVPLLPLGSIGPWGRVEGELKTQKWGVVSDVHRTATKNVFFSMLLNVVQYVGHSPAHILV